MFDNELRDRLGMENDRFEDLKKEFLGRNIPVVDREDGQRSDKGILMTHMEWCP